MNNIIKNTKFNNLVNYTTIKSSADFSRTNHYNSVDPTSLAFLSKNNLIVDYRFINISEKEIEKKENVASSIMKTN